MVASRRRTAECRKLLVVRLHALLRLLDASVIVDHPALFPLMLEVNRLLEASKL